MDVFSPLQHRGITTEKVLSVPLVSNVVLGDVCVTDCVVAELEKLGHRYRLALHLAKDPRIKRLKCSHAGTYADDCIVQRVTEVRSALQCVGSFK